MDDNYYELRHVIKSDKKASSFYFDEINNSKTLEDNIFEYNKIVLLGNPGIGKSTELQNLFNLLWSKIDINGIIPFRINLKNFRPINVFEDLLNFDGWKSLSQIIFILDGLDEISEIEDFLSAFEIFMNKYKSSNFKYVISCRTNIFEKFLVKIAEFETFYLTDLNLNQSESILMKKFKIDLGTLNVRDKHFQYLKTPFFLNLFAEYYKSENKLPDSDAKMWEIYVNKHLEIQVGKIKKKRLLNVPQEIKELKKIALIIEFQQKNFITPNELNEIIGSNYSDIIETPFLINLEDDKKKFGFEHRQLQEYFVAKTLSEKSYEDILSIIKIEGLEKVHPTLNNSISFLINLMNEGEQRDKLIHWIQINQLELLIKADSDRIDEKLKNEVFKNYFEYVCIKKAHWITTDRTFSVVEIAKFGDNEINFNYLLSIIDNNQMIFRARISALDLISYFNNISRSCIENLNSFLISNLQSAENTNQIKSSMLHCILVRKICLDDVSFLEKILDIFKDESNKEINSEILNLINEFDDIDIYSNYVMDEFLRENNIIKREEKDDVIRGNSYVLNQIILKIKNSNTLIGFLKYYFDSQYNIDTYSSDLEKIIEKCIQLECIEKGFVLRLFEKLDIKQQHFYLEQPFRELISRLNKESTALIFDYLLNNFEFRDVNYLLANIADDLNINLIVEKIIKGKKFENNEIEFFRNYISNSEKRDLAMTFNKEMIDIGFKFKEELLTNEEIELIKNKIKRKPQENFDILFNEEKFIQEFVNIFSKHDNQIDKEKYYEIHKIWYRENGHGNIIDIALRILSKILHKANGAITLVDVKKMINEDFYFNLIGSELENDRNKIIEISDDQKFSIQNWVNKKIEEIDFSNIFSTYSNGFNLLNDYSKWKQVIYFSRRLALDLPQHFLLDSLIVPETSNYDSEITLFNYLKEKIDDAEVFNAQVINNLSIENFPTFIFDKHIDYAIEKKLSLAYNNIRKYLLDQDREYNIKIKLYNFYKIERDVDLLKECARSLDNFKAWEALDILMDEGIEKVFCFNKSLEYLRNTENSSKRFISNALNVLFKLNKVDAVKYYYNFLSIELFASAYLKSFSNYTAIENYEILEKFFFRIYGKDELDRSFNSAANFLTQYISNLSKHDLSYFRTKLVLSQIRSKLEKETDDSQIFQINLLIDISDNSYYNSKSKPLSFNEAFKKVNEII